MTLVVQRLRPLTLLCPASTALAGTRSVGGEFRWTRAGEQFNLFRALTLETGARNPRPAKVISLQSVFGRRLYA